MQIKLYYIVVILFLAVTVGSASAETLSTKMACMDIRKVDVNNLSLMVGGMSFPFQNGEAATTTDFSSKKIQGNANIERDNIVEASPSSKVRFLLIHNSYGKGGGWKFYLVGYTCNKGTLKQVFERDGSSLKIDKLDAKGVVISVVPLTSTSARKHFAYHWNEKYQKYVAEPEKQSKK